MAHLPHRLPILVILGLGLGLGLTGCIDRPQPTPTPSPAPTTPAAAAPIECDAVLGSDGYAKLAEDGLEPVEPQLFDALAIQLEEAGGTACAWGLPQSDVGLTLERRVRQHADLAESFVLLRSRLADLEWPVRHPPPRRAARAARRHR